MSRVVSIASMPNPNTSTDDDARRVAHRRRDVDDARADVDALRDRERVRHPCLVGGEVRVLVEEVVLGHPDVLEVRAIGCLHDVELGPQHVLLGLPRFATVVRVVHADEDTELHSCSFQGEVPYGCWLETDTTSPVM